MNENNGIGLPGVLLVVFLVLKLTGNIAWSWWWVTSPVWIPIVVVFAIVLFAGVIGVIGILGGMVMELWRDR